MAENILFFHVLELVGQESCMGEGDMCPSTVSEGGGEPAGRESCMGEVTCVPALLPRC